MRAAPEVRQLPGIHGAAHAGQQEGVHEECGQLSGHQRHREEAGALLRVHAHKEAVFPAQKVAESELGCEECWFYMTALETMSTSGSVRIHPFFFWSLRLRDTTVKRTVKLVKEDAGKLVFPEDATSRTLQTLKFSRN